MKMLSPGTAGRYIVPDGTVFVPGVDGTVDAATQYVPALASLGFRIANTLVSTISDGPTLTAAAAASCLPAAALITLPANLFTLGKVLQISAQGRLSCAVTT